MTDLKGPVWFMSEVWPLLKPSCEGQRGRRPVVSWTGPGRPSTGPFIRLSEKRMRGCVFFFLSLPVLMAELPTFLRETCYLSLSLAAGLTLYTRYSCLSVSFPDITSLTKMMFQEITLKFNVSFRSVGPEEHHVFTVQATQRPPTTP